MLPPPPPAAAGRRPSLDGIPRTHRASGWARPPLSRRVWLACGVGAVVLVAVVVVTWDRLGPFTLTALLSGFVPQVVTAVAHRRSWTVMEDEGVRVSNGLTRARLHRWEDVSTVVVEGRYAERSVLRLRNWADVPLPHVPADVAQTLRDRIDPTPVRPPVRRVETATAGPDGDSRKGPSGPVDDTDLEGPFRRGPLRR